MARRSMKLKGAESAAFKALGLSDIAAGRGISNEQAQQLTQMTEAEVYAIRGVDERLLRMVNCELRRRRLSLVRVIGGSILSSTERFESLSDVKGHPPQVIIQHLENPLYSFDHPDGEGGNRRKIPVAISMRESPAIWMWGHGQINDSQLRAASDFRRWYEAAGGAGVKAMDTTKEPVDGGFVSDGLTDRKMRAGRELKAAMDRLGKRRFDLVQNVCGQCIWIKDLDSRRRTQDAYSDMLKESLDSLAIFWGYASEPHKKVAS